MKILNCFKFLPKSTVMILFCFLVGCATSERRLYDYGFAVSKGNIRKDKEQLTNIEHIYIGMTKKEVLSIMGDSIEIGYKQKGEASYDPILLKSPYKEEIINGKKHHYDVLYFFIKVINPDGEITKDELIPLIFEREKLVGKGYEFFSRINKK